MYIPRVPHLQIRRNCLVYYELPVSQPPRNASDLTKVKKYTGKMTTGSKKRIDSAVDILLQRSPERIIYNPITKKRHPFTINFVTLTISARRNIGIREGYEKMLAPWLRKMKRYGVKDYLWKAEYQERGQLHYHVTTNVFINWTIIRNEWNNLQRKNRYLDEYAKKHRHFDANSTDIHAVWKVNDIGAYLGKYLSKENEDNNPLIKKEKGKVWDCSKELKQKRFSVIMSHQQEIDVMRMIHDKQIKETRLEHCTIFKLPNPKIILSPSQLSSYNKWLT